MKRLGIYVHVPYCIRKCPYCGFYSKAVGDSFDVHGEEYKVYKDKLIKSIKEYGEVSMGKTVDSIFFGGGTPTVLRAHDLIGILGEIKDAYQVPHDCEITVEANPGTVDTEKLKKLADWGFNRLSLGIQSFDNHVLRTLGRIHTAKEAEEAFLMAREAGFRNINLDLMFGIPGQSVSTWVRTLEKALSLRPEHISFYSLQLEEGTPFFKKFEAGELQELPDVVDREMYHFAIRMLKDAGYHHYEISNAALPGFECRHNIKYWTLHEYLGFGPSAAAFSAGYRRTMDEDQVETDFHQNSDFDNMSEFVFTGLRMTRGINYGEFRARFGIGFEEAFAECMEELEEYIRDGFVRRDVDAEGNRMGIRLTEKGIDISNQILSLFV